MKRDAKKIMAEERRKLAAGEDSVAEYLVTPDMVRGDPKLYDAMVDRELNAWELALKAGFHVEVRAQEWNDGNTYFYWKATPPPALEHEVQALVWDSPERPMEYTLTRSTNEPGWQLTNWMNEHEPWGHRVLKTFDEAFDDSIRGAGQPVTWLAQVVFRDGHMLTRADAKEISTNNHKRRRAPKTATKRTARTKARNVRELVRRASK